MFLDLPVADFDFFYWFVKRSYYKSVYNKFFLYTQEQLPLEHCHNLVIIIKYKFTNLFHI